MRDRDDSLNLPLKSGTDPADRGREHEIGGEVPSGMLEVTSATREVTDEAAAALKEVSKQLTFIRQNLGRAAAEAKRLPDGVVPDISLAVGELIEDISRACAWAEEARECLKKPLKDDDPEDSLGGLFDVGEGEPDF